MKTITDSQQEIIDYLYKEFTKMNEVDKTEYSLFNPKPILDELNKKKTLQTEIDLHNKAMVEMQMTRLIDYCNVLNNDFESAGLSIMATLNHTELAIRPNPDKSRHDHTNNFWLYCKTITENCEFNIDKIVGYKYRNEASSSSVCKIFDTIEELINYAPIQLKFKKIIEETNKRPR